MAHHHEHHDHHPSSYSRAFAAGIVLNSSFVGIELVFGVLSGSLALVADAGHNLSDVLALVLAWGAASLSRRPPTPHRTYGWRRSSILAALTNAVLLLVVTGGVAWEAVRRFTDPTPVEGGIVLWVAALGTIINAVSALFFLSGRDHDMNIRGAFLHLASDAAVSLGVVLTGLLIMTSGQLWLDPAASLLVSAVILWGTWSLLRDALNLALDAVPEGIEMDQVHTYLTSLPSVLEVHDLHVWGMSTTEAALTAHLVMATPTASDALLNQVAEELHHRFGIEHTTLQLECGDPAYPCVLAPAEVV
jgi:cobalt-zinc-cadmium efflux system protein